MVFTTKLAWMELRLSTSCMVLSGEMFSTAVEDSTFAILTTVDVDYCRLFITRLGPDLDCCIIPFFITNCT